MLNLSTNATLLQVVTGSGVSSILVHTSYVNLNGTTVTPGSTNTPPISTATTTTVVAAPVSGVTNVRFVSIYNSSASPCAVTVQSTDGSNVITLFSFNMLAGYTVHYNGEGDGWVVYDASGRQLVNAGSPNAIAAGSQTATSGTVAFINSNGMSFGMSGSTGVTATFAPTGDWYDNLFADQPTATGSGAVGSMTNFTGSVSSLFVFPLQGLGELWPFNITANTLFFPDVSISGSTATMSVAFTSKWFLGIYTLNGSSLSLLNSMSVSFGYAGAATNNSTGFAGGLRFGTAQSSLWSTTPVFAAGSRYWAAWFWSSAGILNQTGMMIGNFNFSTGQRSGILGFNGSSSSTNGWAPFYGVYSAQTAALPTVIGSGDLGKTASIAGFVPHLIIANNASLSVF